MLQFLRSILGRIGRTIRRRPKTLLLTLAGALAIAAAAFYIQAVREWRGAVSAMREGKPAAASEKLKWCLRVWPDNPQVRRLAARAAWQTGDFATAESHLNACLKLEHEATEDTQLEFLLMRAQSGEVDEVAFILMDFVNRNHPDSALIFETIASAYMKSLRFGPAHYYLNLWIAKQPDCARAYHYRGWVMERMDQPKLALDDYLRSLELNPNLDAVRQRVAEMYLEDKEPLNALPHLRILLDRDPNRPEALARMGQCKFLQGEHAEARRLLEQVADRMANDSHVWLYLGRLDIEDQQPARAEERLRHALAVDPSETEVRFVLVTALRMQGRDSEAGIELAEYDRQKAILARTNKLLQAEARQPSSDAQSAFEIGSLLLDIHHDEQGLHWLSEALNRDAGHVRTRQRLADFYAQKGDRERAASYRKPFEE